MCEDSGNIRWKELGCFFSMQCNLKVAENFKILYFRNKLGDKEQTRKTQGMVKDIFLPSDVFG